MSSTFRVRLGSRFFAAHAYGIVFRNRNRTDRNACSARASARLAASARRRDVLWRGRPVTIYRVARAAGLRGDPMIDRRHKVDTPLRYTNGHGRKKITCTRTHAIRLNYRRYALASCARPSSDDKPSMINRRFFAIRQKHASRGSFTRLTLSEGRTWRFENSGDRFDRFDLRGRDVWRIDFPSRNRAPEVAKPRVPVLEWFPSLETAVVRSKRLVNGVNTPRLHRNSRENKNKNRYQNLMENDTTLEKE